MLEKIIVEIAFIHIEQNTDLRNIMMYVRIMIIVI